MRGLTIAGLFVALLSWGCDGQEAPGRASSEPASSGPASSEPVAFEVPPDPSAPVRVVEQVGAPLRRGAGYADVRLLAKAAWTREAEAQAEQTHHVALGAAGLEIGRAHV